MASTPPATPASERLERVLEECQLSAEQKQRLMAAIESCVTEPAQGGELRLQLFPCNQEVTAIMNRHRYNPKLQLTVKGTKTFGKVLQHVKKKWISHDTKQFIFPGTFFLRPRDATKEVADTALSWNNDEKITIDDIFKKFGKKDLLQLEYGWTTISPIPHILPFLPFGSDQNMPRNIPAKIPLPLSDTPKNFLPPITTIEAPPETSSVDGFFSSLYKGLNSNDGTGLHFSEPNFFSDQKGPSESLSWVPDSSLFGANSNNSLLNDLGIVMQPSHMASKTTAPVTEAASASGSRYPSSAPAATTDSPVFREFKFHDGSTRKRKDPGEQPARKRQKVGGKY